MIDSQNKKFKFWVYGVTFLTIVLPLILKIILSSYINITLLEAWGIVALFVVLHEGFTIVKPRND